MIGLGIYLIYSGQSMILSKIKSSHLFSPFLREIGLCRRSGSKHLQLYSFSADQKKKQLILHDENELVKMHMRPNKNNKGNPWETIRDSSDRNQFKVSLIGLPNSGKSTLFNCMVGEPVALVDNIPGMTRDRKEYPIMNGLIKVIDTPGVEVSALGKKASELLTLKQDIFKQTILAINESDLIAVVVDAKKPITTDEIQLVKYLRALNKSDQKIIVLCNKCDGSFDEQDIINQVYKLGVDQVFMCSGTEGTGIFEVLNYLKSSLPQELKNRYEAVQAERCRKFELLIEKLKHQIKGLKNEGVSINVKQWQHDFRQINADPELNEDLDFENFQDFLVRPEEAFSAKRGTEVRNLKMKNTIKISIIGRPNVGKSSLINQILGEDRLVVSQTPHTTRDSVINKILYKQRKVQIIDTAGLNYPNFDRNSQEVIKKIQVSTMLHVKQSHVVVYLMDAFSAFKIDDFSLIRNVIKQGRPIIIAVNKWQAIKQEYKYKAINYLKKQIDQNLGYELNGYPLVFVSAKMNEGIQELLDYVLRIYDKWNTRISTGLLNNWLTKFKKVEMLPKDNEMTLKITYLIQARVRPPHLVFFVSNKSLFKSNYLRFVTENIAKEFEFDGVPLRISLRSSNNKQNQAKHRNKSPYPKKPSPINQKMEELKNKYSDFGMK